MTVPVTVKNISTVFSGKESVQLYLRSPHGRLEQPLQQLKAVKKTSLLQPGETTSILIAFPLRELASFDEKRSAYVAEAGGYALMVGNSSRGVQCVGCIQVDVEIIVRYVSADIGVNPHNKEKIDFLHAPQHEVVIPDGCPKLTVTAEDVTPYAPAAADIVFDKAAVPSTLRDVKEKRVPMAQFIAQMSVEELAVLCCGYVPGLPFGGLGKPAPCSIQYADGSDIGTSSHPSAFPGYTNPAMEKYGIWAACYKDGPASVGQTAWPTGMMPACTMDPELLSSFGAACGWEAESLDIDSWLAPGMNIIRNPIGGRNFENFSEDPYLCGLCGTAIVRGAQENNRVTMCPKHFALNEQETFRRGSARKHYDAVDSIADARTVREIYLKTFEMTVREACPRTLMTGFNKINGTFAAGNHALCGEILRGEWGYQGVVVTDWGDLDTVVDGADAVAAGNDVVLPGGPPVIHQILTGYKEGRVTLDALRRAAAHLMYFVMGSRSWEKLAYGEEKA